MIVTRATPGDLNAIAQIHQRARQQAMPWLPILHTAPEIKWFFENTVFPRETVSVASVGSEVIGFISCHGQWVNHLYVDPDHWHRKVGTTLLEPAKLATDKLQLWTFQKNQAARKFYAANGFAEREFTDGSNNEEKTPDLRMTWQSRRQAPITK